MAKKTSVGSVPTEALKEGGLNETVSDEVRDPKSPDEDSLDEGPKRSETGGYTPAAYRTRSGSIRVDN